MNMKTTVLVAVLSAMLLGRVTATEKVKYHYRHYDPGSFVASLGSIVPDHPRTPNHLTEVDVTTPQQQLTEVQMKDSSDSKHGGSTSQLFHLIVKHLQPTVYESHHNSTVESAFVGCSRARNCQPRSSSCSSKMADTGKTTAKKSKRCRKNNDGSSSNMCRMQKRIMKMVAKPRDTPNDWLYKINKYLDGYNMSIVVVGGDYQKTLVNGEIIGYIGNGQPRSQSTRVENIAHIYTVK